MISIKEFITYILSVKKYLKYLWLVYPKIQYSVRIRHKSKSDKTYDWKD